MEAENGCDRHLVRCHVLATPLKTLDRCGDIVQLLAAEIESFRDTWRMGSNLCERDANDRLARQVMGCSLAGGSSCNIHGHAY